MEKIIVRMPPSPTGFLHLGTARAALFNYLFAKKNHGDIIFRWEDTDKVRSKKEFEIAILEGLKWLGMDFKKESIKFVRQTENIQKHKLVLKKLWDNEKIFPCFMTPKEIENLRQEAQKRKENFVFWSPFREMKKEDAEKKMKTHSFVWRLRTPRHQEIIFQDLVKGSVKINSSTIGDFVIARSDGSVLYLLANVVDDLEVNISHVIRGDDHVSNTPKQILLFQALEEKPPHYAHIPLVLDAKKKKLSKRNVEANVCVLVPDFQKAGFIPEGVINGLAFLGWNPKTTEEVFSMKELCERFELEKVNKAGAQYDFNKMEWFNAQWMKKISLINLKNYFLEWNLQFGSKDNKPYELVKNENFLKALNLVREKAKNLKEIREEIDSLIFPINIDTSMLTNEKMKIDEKLLKKVLQEILNMLKNLPETDFTKEKLRTVSVKKITEMELKNGQFLWPFRVALSGKTKSAGPFEIGEVLGKNECIERIKTAFHQ